MACLEFRELLPPYGIMQLSRTSLWAAIAALMTRHCFILQNKHIWTATSSRFFI